MSTTSEVPSREDLEELSQEAKEAYQRHLGIESKRFRHEHVDRSVRDGAIASLDKAVRDMAGLLEEVYERRGLSLQEVYQQEVGDVPDSIKDERLYDALKRPFTNSIDEKHALSHETLLDYGFGGLVER